MPPAARYDGYADWYESWNEPHAERNAAELTDLLGPGDGLCLDLGCGAGHNFATLAATGRTVVGLDYSADQLRFAKTRSRQVVRADGGVRAHTTYREAGWQPEAPWWGQYIRRRVGMRHHLLADLLNSFIATGLTIEYVAEPGSRPVPNVLGIRARKAE